MCGPSLAQNHGSLKYSLCGIISGKTKPLEPSWLRATTGQTMSPLPSSLAAATTLARARGASESGVPGRRNERYESIALPTASLKYQSFSQKIPSAPALGSAIRVRPG